MSGLLRYVRLTLSLALLLALNACSSPNLFKPYQTRNVNAVAFAQASTGQYVIRKDDKISVSVWNHDDMSVGSIYGIYNSNEVYGKWLMVDQFGEVPVPKIGRMKLEGLTLVQARDLLLREYKKWVVDPILDVRVLNREVTVLGEMKAPGKFALDKEANTLVELLGRAGDFDFYADRRHIQIIRSINNQPQSLTVDLTRMDEFGTQNVKIIPGDVIYVPARGGKQYERRFGPSVVPIASVITAVIVALNFFR